MAPPGRRRHFSAYSIAFALLLFFTSSASAAVLGIDFGTLNIKAVLVKPGIPLEIVLTKDSKRKEVAAIAFKGARDSNGNAIVSAGRFPERVYGADALALQGRMPGEVFPNLKQLLGRKEDAFATYHSRYPAVKIFDNEAITSSTFPADDSPWTVEEILAMELASIRRNAEGMAGRGVSVENVVITIPAFYTAAEKFAVKRAADLAGLNVLGLISDGLAVGIDYAKSRTFGDVTLGEKPEHHLVFDMGAGSTTATVLRFQGRSVKDIGKFNKTVQEVAVIGAGWDRTLGGDALTQVVAEDFIHKLMTKPVIKSRGIELATVQNDGRLMSRIWKDAEKARQVLSANTETSSSFEELLPDVDFRTKLSRAEFEKLTEQYAERVTKPIEDALAAAQLKITDIDSIILHGGAIRTPFVQKRLEKFAGATKLKSNVNADESAVFGAAFKGASLSASFKVKEIRTSDLPGYAGGLSIPGDGKERYQVVFNTGSPVGSNGTVKQIASKNKDDFTFSLFQKADEDTPFAEVTTTNLTASVKALKDQFGCEKADVSTKFSLRLSTVDGLPDVVVGTVSCETDGKASVGDSVKDWLGFGKKKDKQSSDDEDAEVTEEVTSTDSTATSASPKESDSTSKAAEKPKKVTESINVGFTVKEVNQKGATDLTKARERLAAFDASDKARLAREDALNGLESYTYYVRDFLDNSEYSPFSTPEQRAALTKLLASTKEYMDSKDFLDATTDVLTQKLSALKDLVTPVLSRRTESLGRPEKLKGLKSSLGQTQTMIENIRKEIEKAKDAASSSVAEAAKSASSLAEAATSAVKGEDDLDELEEPTTPEASPSPSAKSKIEELISPYTDEDVSSISAIYEQIQSWLTEKEAEQGKLQIFDDPAFTIKELEKRAKQLGDATMQMVQKKIRIPKKSTTTKKKSSKTKSPKKSATGEADESATNESAESTRRGKPKIVTVQPGDDMPTEEEILRMVSEAKASSTSTRDEL